MECLGAAFSKKFSTELTSVLRTVFSDILERGLLPPSMRQAVALLIPKRIPDITRQTVEDFRPISLLTCDYKKLAKILTKRLERGL